MDNRAGFGHPSAKRSPGRILMLGSRPFIVLACAAAIALPSAALAQKSQAQLDWEASQAAFLADNAKKPGWKTTADGLQYHRTSKPNPKGAQPTEASDIEVKYVGTTISDNEFDASPEGGTSTFKVEDVIKGWREGLPMMREGESWEFAIPADLGYGDRVKPRIPQGSALIFKVTLIKVLSNPAAPSAPAKAAAKKK
jgi:FKBP-type peptidyl-prolyl cis-trans isomerase